MRLVKLFSIIALSVLLSSCSSFNLSESHTTLTVKKQRRAKEATCVVKPFTFEPVGSPDQEVTLSDITRWQEILVDGLNQANIFAEVVAVTNDSKIVNAQYVMSGKIRKFYFKKNWVPTFFPGHIALSFFTLTVYTWAAG